MVLKAPVHVRSTMNIKNSARLGDLVYPAWKPVPLRRPRMGVGLVDEAKARAWELEEPLKFLAVGAGWVAGDFLGHQLFETTEGDKTPPGYYGNKLLYAIPFLLAGKMLSDNVVKGSPFVRALTIGTTANTLMQIGYLLSGLSGEFNATVYLMHEALLVPLSFLLVGDDTRPKAY